MGGELAERLLQRAQGFEILLALIIGFQGLDLFGQRGMGLAQFVDEGFHMGGNDGLVVLGALQPGDQPHDGLVDPGNRERGAGFHGLDAAGELVKR